MDCHVNRWKKTKKFPKHFDPALDVDPFTQQKWLKKKLSSPHCLILPNYVVDSKSFVKIILKKGEAQFGDPIDRRPYTQEQREEILEQIHHIFGISKNNFYSCFEPISFSFNKLTHIAVNKTGQYSNAAKRALAFAISDLESPALSCIDIAFNQIEQEVEKKSAEVLKNSQFKKKIQIYLSDLTRSSFNPNRFKLLPSFDPIHVSIPISNSIVFEALLDVSFLIHLTIYKHFVASFRNNLMEMAAQHELDKLKTAYVRELRLKILERTLFFQELKKEYEGWIRMKRFETLSGIALTSEEFQLD